MEALVRNSKVGLVPSAFTVAGLAPSENSPAAEKLKQFLESVDSSEAIQPWTVLLRMRDVLEATTSSRRGGEWPNSLSTSQLQACKAMMEEEALSQAEMEQLQCIVTTVLQCELTLLESELAKAQTVSQRAKQNKSAWHPSNIIFSTDFDVTCTQVDSCYSLVSAAEVAAVKRHGGRTSISAEKLNEEYESILLRHAELTKSTISSFDNQTKDEEATYWRDEEGVGSDTNFLSGMDPSLKSILKESISSIAATVRVAEEKNLSAHYNEAGLRKSLIKLGKLEMLCNEDIKSAGVLSGATREEIRTEAKKVLLRPNCSEVLQELVHVGTDIHIVSANWSRDLIIGGLPQLPKEKLFVHCNDLLFDSVGCSKGIIDMTVVDAFDKEKVLRALRKLPANDQELNEQRDEKMLVYMGDSHNDLLGLLEADLGIVIGESSHLRRVLALHDIKLLPLAEATSQLNMSRLYGSKWSYRKSGILFETQGWTEVEACLFGRESEVTPEDSSLLLSLSSQIEKLIEKVQNQQPSLLYADRRRNPPLSLDMIKVSN